MVVIVRVAENRSVRTNANATLRTVSSLSTISTDPMLWGISSMITLVCRRTHRPIPQSRLFLGALTSRRQMISQWMVWLVWATIPQKMCCTSGSKENQADHFNSPSVSDTTVGTCRSANIHSTFRQSTPSTSMRVSPFTISRMSAVSCTAR